MRYRTGYSLIELAFALVLVAVLSAIAAPSLAHGRDVLAVRAASGELVGLIAAARAAAILSGGALLIIDVPAGAGWIERGDGTRGERHDIRARYGVSLASERAGSLVIRYDALGIGRMSSASMRVQRGRAYSVVTISAYGRVRQ